MSRAIEQPADYGVTRGAVKVLPLANGWVYSPQRQPIASRREGRLREAPSRGGARYLGVGQYSQRNSAGTERQAIARVTRQDARDFLASLA